MELQFVGDIRAVRVGDKFRAVGTLQSRRTGNVIEVRTELDLPSLIAEARQVYEAARHYLAQQGQTLEALPTDGSLEGMGLSKDDQIKQLRREVEALKRRRDKLPATAKSRPIVVARLSELDGHVRQLEAGGSKTADQNLVANLKRKLIEEKKRQVVEGKLRAAANQRMVQRRLERKGYEDQLAAVKQQLQARDIDAAKQGELDQQAAQYETQLAASGEQMAQLQAQYETRLATVQLAPGEQVARSPAAVEAAAGDVAEADDLAAIADDLAATIEGMGWGFKDIFKKFKKALAVVFRSKIVKGLVKAATTTVAGPAGSAAANAVYKSDETKPKELAAPPEGAITGLGAGVWYVPGLRIQARHAVTWMRLLRAAQSGHAHSLAIKNRVVLMARLGQPAAVKTFWLLRSIERLLPEVKQRIEASAGAGAEIDVEQALAQGEPPAVAAAALTGAGDATEPVKVRCMMMDPDTREMYQVPFQMALGARQPVRRRAVAARQSPAVARVAAQRTAAAQRAAAVRSKQSQASVAQRLPSQPSAFNAALPGTIPAPQQPYGQPYGQPGITDYTQSYGGGGGGGGGGDYGQQYAPQPDYSQDYSQYQQSYGDYSAAENQPGFDPYSPASYGFDPSQFSQ